MPVSASQFAGNHSVFCDVRDFQINAHGFSVTREPGCIALTLRLYANHKGIALAGVDLTLEYDRVHADDCEECDERLDGWIERIRTHVKIRGTFDDAQRTRLAQVAERCPVHKTLANQVQIFDSVTFEEPT